MLWPGVVTPVARRKSQWVQQVFVVLIAVGFPFSLMLGWAFDITRSGIQRTPNVSGLHVSHPRQIWTLAGVGTAIAALPLSAYWFGTRGGIRA